MNAFPYIRLLRPKQWTKNLMLFFPPFLSGALFTSHVLSYSGISAFVSFCCVSSALYVFNDLNDVDRDVLHPVKRLRPLASGTLSHKVAARIALILAFAGFGLAFLAAQPLIPYLLLYIAIMMAYAWRLKNIPIVDLFCISCGFLIRLQAGGAIFNIKISEWLFLSVFFLSLCLSSGKRLSELRILGSDASEHRASLFGYTDHSLDALLQITAATVLVTYAMYTLSHPRLIYTVPLCTYGLFRYLLRVKRGNSGDPTESLFNDPTLLCVSVLWALVVAGSIYL